MFKRDKEIQSALVERAKAKNNFIEISNNKSSRKKEIIDSYKQYRKADDALINIYERIKYDNVAWRGKPFWFCR